MPNPRVTVVKKSPNMTIIKKKPNMTERTKNPAEKRGFCFAVCLFLQNNNTGEFFAFHPFEESAAGR